MQVDCLYAGYNSLKFGRLQAELVQIASEVSSRVKQLCRQSVKVGMVMGGFRHGNVTKPVYDV